MIVRGKHLYYHRVVRLAALHQAADLGQLDDDEPVQPLLAVGLLGPAPPPLLAVAGAAVQSGWWEGGGATVPRGLLRLLRLVLQLGQLELPDLQLVGFLPGLEEEQRVMRSSNIMAALTLKIFSSQSLITSFSDLATLKSTLEVETAALL